MKFPTLITLSKPFKISLYFTLINIAACSLALSEEHLPWNVRLAGNIKIEANNAAEAVNQLNEIIGHSSAPEKGFKGCIVNFHHAPPRGAKMDLHNIDVLTLLTHVSEQCGFRYFIKGDTVLLESLTRSESHLFQYNESVSNGLGLPREQLTPDLLIKKFADLGLILDEEEISVSERTLTVLVTANEHKVEYLRAMLVVFNKGKKIH